MNATFRCKRSFLAIGGLSIAMAIAFAAALFLPFDEAPPHGRLSLCALLGTVVALCSLVGTSLILGSIRHRLTIAERSVESVGVFGTKRIALDEVIEARWRLYGDAGSLTLKTSAVTLGISLSNYGREETRELVRFLRFRLPADIQHGWDRYWGFHWALFDEPEPISEEWLEERRSLRRRIHGIFAFSTAVILAAAFLVVRYTGEVRHLAWLVVFFGTWVLCHFTDPPRGKVRRRMRAASRMHPVVLAGLVVLPVTFVICLPMGAFGIAGGRVVLGVGSVLSCVLVFMGVFLQEGRMRAYREEGAKLAAEEYLRLPHEPVPGRNPPL